MVTKHKHSRPAPHGAPAILQSTWLASLACVLAFFALYLLIFRPGYQVDDDITMVQLASGYLGGVPVPFLVFSNVVLGFLLNVLYRLPTNLNWEILLFFAVQFLAAWCLVHAILTVGADRVLFAVDYPFEDHTQAVTWFDAVEIAEPDRLKIGRTNAMRLFDLN